jgi:diguanylate cyclase (GGDEF)-like protein
MNNPIARSLARKIIVAATIGTFLIIIITFGSAKKIGEKALYNAEIEKANFLAETVAQLLSVNLYLGLDENINQLAEQLYANQHVLSVTISSNGKVIKTLFDTSPQESSNVFNIHHDILEPNSNQVIGQLDILYSSLYYVEALKKYNESAIISIGILLLILLMLSFYFHRLLHPLRSMRNMLKSYNPEAPFYLPFTKRSDEIGLISNAFNQMHEKVLKYTKLQHDINDELEKKVAEKTKELYHRLYYDPLTNLPNRTALIESLNDDGSGGLLIVNIDDFKEVNDFFGNAIGDLLLVEFALLISNLLIDKEPYRAYRLHGDEFAIHINKPTDEEGIIAFAQTLLNAIDSMHFECEETQVSVSATVGMTLQMDSALEKADIALKLAKRQSKVLLLYDEHYSIEKQYRKNIIWIRKLKHAIENEQLIPFFQPIYDNRSGKIVSYESLIRLRENDGGIIAPGEFLHVMKKAKLTDKLTRIVIEKSCQQFAEIDATFSVNLGFEDINNEATVAFIKERVIYYGVEKKIIFEILETEGITNYQSVANFIGQIHAMGSKIAIDDFGSGYSNFEHMMKLHVDYIKIDGSLIKNIDHDEHARIIVQTIVDFAQKLQIQTVAEFVHNEAVYETVKALNIDRSQGFFLAKPALSILQNS